MLVFGNNIIEFDVLDSTNSYLLEKSKRGNCFEGDVVYSHFQREGRGQRNSSWSSNPGENLMCSIFIHPHFLSATNFFIISKIIAIAVHKEVSRVCKDALVEVKWPNDIYVDKKKIGGILIENQFKGAVINQAVIGLGLNINQTNFEGLNATSLKLEVLNNFDVKEVLLNILQNFENLYFKVKNGDFIEVEHQYVNMLMNYNERSTYTVRNNRCIGTIKNVRNNGLLELEINNSIEYFQFKEISFVI